MTSAVATGRLAEGRAERFYRPELDVLRFFAFFAIFVLHVPPGTPGFYLQQGGVLGTAGLAGAFGVDLFFVLSGYLITTLLLKEQQESGDIEVRSFYIRRILRIWPLYFFYIVLAFAISRLPSSITNIPFGGINFPTDAICLVSLACFLFNFAPCGHMDRTLIAHFWSISIEEQFYLFWPLILRNVPARRLIAVPIVMFAVASVARVLSVFFRLAQPVWSDTFTRLDPIAVGIAIAIVPRPSLRIGSRVALVLIGAASWLCAAYYCSLPFEVSAAKVAIGYPMVALGSGAFLIAALRDGGRRGVGRIERVLIYLGRISYGLYVYNRVAIYGTRAFMYHVALGWFVRSGISLWTAWPVYLALAFGANVALAAASYRWLEAPFLRLKSRFTSVPSRPV